MRKIMQVVLVAFLFAAHSPLVAARGGGGGGAAHSGGPAPNSQAAANSNGRFAADRDKGRDRAEDRRSAKATVNAKKHHRKTVSEKTR